MKKLIMLLVAWFIITGCTNNRAYEDAKKEGKEAEELQDNEEYNEATADSDTSEETMTVKDNVESRIHYPVFTNIKNENLVNQLILDYINELDSLYNADNPAALSIHYQIMFQNEQYVSIFFSGDLKGAAYPRTFKSTLNIDITEASRLKLNQIVNLNDDFINLVTNAIQEQFDSIGADMDTAIPMGIKDKLEHADSSITSDVQSYFTSDEVVIILSVQHAIGDYLEVSIPFTP